MSKFFQEMPIRHGSYFWKFLWKVYVYMYVYGLCAICHIWYYCYAVRGREFHSWYIKKHINGNSYLLQAKMFMQKLLCGCLKIYKIVNALLEYNGKQINLLLINNSSHTMWGSIFENIQWFKSWKLKHSICCTV